MTLTWYFCNISLGYNTGIKVLTFTNSFEQMKSLFIEAGDYSPKVSFDTSSNVFEITGDSFGEDTLRFFNPIVDWLQRYLKQNNRFIEFNIQMNYLNTSSFKRFNEILAMLERYYMATKTLVKINWICNQDDDEIIDYGEDIKEFFENLPINIHIKTTA